MAKPQITKIIYFDKETILNILQERNKGNKQSQTGISTSAEASVEIQTEASVKLNVPLGVRISFLFSGRLGSKFLIKRESETTITSTEISEFDKIKNELIEQKNVKISDIENSSTSFRVAGNFLRFLKGQVQDVDVKEFNAVLNGFEGYDTYKISETTYVRFNNSAFVSNYKRNELLNTEMTLYCIKVCDCEKETFDFIEQINKMQKMFSNVEQAKTLADIYPPKAAKTMETESHQNKSPGSNIELFDVVYACIAEPGGA